ncbi:MAG: serine/threonine protein kinase [Oscillospiraceae bacterium]|nr:serine/threonine protein kinase [Oscillospiraceae bacterium]
MIGLSEKYDILDTLSESNKCVVMSARSRTDGEQVVIRVIYNAAEGILQSLLRVKSPHVVQVLDVVQDGSDVILVEKFIEGGTLRQFLDNGGQLTEDEILFLFVQLCHALTAIHREGIIHRDLKPSNIMFHNGVAVLIDFDVARQHDPFQSQDTVYMGTKGYAAPEQYGFAQTDKRSDIYSLGVVMKELLGGRITGVKYQDVIKKCTQFDPANRYQSVNEILKELRPFSKAGRAFHIRQLRTKMSVPKKIGYVVMGFYCLVVLLPQPHEVTVWDYILSKILYLELVVLLFVPFLNIFHIRDWFPFLKHKNFLLKILGLFLYAVAYVVLLLETNMIVNALYSEQAKSLLVS